MNRGLGIHRITSNNSYNVYGIC